MRDLILDLVRHSIIKDVVECAWTITVDLTGQVVKLNDGLADALAILHREVIQLVFSISNRVMWAEVGFEVINKHHMIIHS